MSYFMKHCQIEHVSVAIKETNLLQITVEKKVVDGTVAEIFKLAGFESKLLQAMFSTLNVTFSLHKADIAFGHILLNGSWNGVVGLLAREERDIAFSKLSDFYERRKVMDFSNSYFEDTLNFIIGQQKPPRSSKEFILSPFDTEVWLLFLVFIIIIIIIMKYLTAELTSEKQWALWYIIGVTCSQGRSAIFDGKSIYITLPLSLWLLTLKILSIFYGDFITASASVNSNDIIDSLEKIGYLFEKQEMQIRVQKGSLMEDYLKRMSSPMGDLYRKVTAPMKLNLEKLPDLTENPIALLFPANDFEITLQAVGNADFQFHRVEEHLVVSNLALGLRKNFECKGSINKVIQALRESGFLSRWVQDLLRPSSLEKSVTSSEEVSQYIQISDLKSTFLILKGAYIFSFIIFMYRYLKRLIFLRSANRSA